LDDAASRIKSRYKKSARPRSVQKGTFIRWTRAGAATFRAWTTRVAPTMSGYRSDRLAEPHLHEPRVSEPRTVLGSARKETVLIVLGVILLVIGLLTGMGLLSAVGAILVIVGAILWILGAVGHAVGGGGFT